MDIRLVLVPTLGSAALLLAALAFQFIGGLEPCQLCIWQRWPHLLASGAGLAFLIARFRAFGLLAAVALIAGAAIAFYHSGVEQGIWEGPATCSASGIDALAGANLLDFTQPVNIISCGEIAWSWLGLSMATWNGLASLVLAGIWATALFQTTRIARP